MTDSQFKNLCIQYGLGEFVSSRQITNGFLNWNFVITTTLGSYFVKNHRLESAQKITRIEETEQFFAEHGIPVIVPIRTLSGQLHIEIEDTVYTVYPFIVHEVSVRSQLTNKQISEMARLLASLHKLSVDVDIPASLVSVSYKQVDVPLFLKKCQNYLVMLDQKQENDIDQSYRKILSLKYDYWEKHSENIGYSDYPRDTLTHGDMHDQNVIFDNNGNITHVFDFELSKIDSRYKDIIKAVYKMFFDEEGFTGKSLAQASLFLNIYHSVFPINKVSFLNIVESYFIDKIASLWLEDTYIRDADSRVNSLVPSYIRLVSICVDDAERLVLANQIADLVD